MTDMDVAAASAALGMSERTVRRWLRQGRLEGYRVGRRIRIPERAVREAVVPYGRPSAAPGSRGEADDVDPVVAYLTSPERLRERRRRAATLMDEIAARWSRPSSGADDTAEAYVRAEREERDRHWDELRGLDRP